jgi:hypothetical protein
MLLMRSEYTNLNLSEATVGWGPGSRKRSGRDEPMCIAIHKCMEPTLRISPYSYLYLKLAKTLSFLLSLMFSTKSENKRVEQVGREKVGEGGE